MSAPNAKQPVSSVQQRYAEALKRYGDLQAKFERIRAAAAANRRRIEAVRITESKSGRSRGNKQS